MSETNDILYMLNPLAKNGHAGWLWEKARKRYPRLPKNPVDVTKADISEMILKKKPEIIAIAGGDGTINAVCTAVSQMKRKPLLSILPFGFGNALSYCLGVETWDKAMSVLNERPEKITIDLMKTNIEDHDRGVINISVGVDARMVFHRQDYKYIGFGSYIVSILRSLLFHPETEITFTIDHAVTLTAKASSLFIANCPVIGQNYLISPDAKLNDGRLDCTLFSTKYIYIRNLRLHGFKHPLYTELGKVRFKASHIRIEGEPFIQIDGDPLVRKEAVEIEILPNQVTFLSDKKEKITQVYSPYL